MASLAALPAPRFDWNADDLAASLRKFKSLCTHYFNGPLKTLSEEEKCSYLQIWLGEEGIDLVSTWTDISNDDRVKLNTYWTKLEKYVSPKSNFRLSRFKLRALKQDQCESVDSFIRRIRTLVNLCNYSNPDEMTLDTLIFGIQSVRVQTKLIELDNALTIDKAIEIARTEEITKSQVQGITASASTSLHMLHYSEKKASNFKDKKKTVKTCYNCGRNHDISRKENCPAFGTKCRACGRENHWSAVCRSQKKHGDSQKPKWKPQIQVKNKQSVHTIKMHEHATLAEEQPQQLYFDSLSVDIVNTSAKVTVQVNGTATVCKVDTGAEGNIIPIQQMKQICPTMDIEKDLQLSNANITAYGGHVIKQCGTCELDVTYRDNTLMCIFHVVDVSGPVILGLQACQDLKLVTLNCHLVNCADTTEVLTYQDISRQQTGNSKEKENLMTKYKDCFNGIGCFEGEYHIILDPSVPPVVHPPRRVPEALREPLKAELDLLCEQQIIAKVDEPTDWVNSFVCVTKRNGSIRLCLDPKDLNAAIKRPHHCTPTLDDCLPKLNGAKYFTILDARSGYWSIKLDEESSKYTTFNCPFGRYRFLRLPFGLVSAQDIFQKKVDETFGDLPGVTGIADDIVIVGYEEDGSDHDANLRAVMERASDKGVKFNPDKCFVKCTSISFYGHTLSADGLAPDQSKVEAISCMDPSTKLQDLQSFLGATQYLSKFIPGLANMAAPLWDLTKKTSEFIWGPEHEKAVNNVKRAIVSATTLKYFNKTKAVKIQVDASQRGLGAMLFQDEGPIAYASKLLTSTESRYSNIEREMLGVIHGLEKFHYYVYGRHVTVETDHKPLEAICKKHLASAPPRIARMLLRIQKYDVSVIYVPGRNIPVADMLSRVSPTPAAEIPGLDVSVHELQKHLNASPMRLNQIREETAKDDNLSLLKEVVMKGWPNQRSDCPQLLHSYWNYRDEITVADGILLKGLRIIIPPSLQTVVLQQLHYAHQGAEKCKLRAKGSVFWANINRDIDEMVKRCGPCQHHQNENKKEPLIPHDVPKRPWHTLGSDLFYWNNSNYLVIADYYSKFPIVRKLNNITSETVISHLKAIFEEHGIPERLISDNGTQYTSEAFRNFSRVWGFEHITSSPNYPQSNGFAERMVQTVKNLLQKCKESGADPHLAMLCLRTTPVSHNIQSPAELLNARVYQSNLPAMTKTALRTEGLEHTNSLLQQRQDKQKEDYDKKASSDLPSVHPRDHVRVFDPTSSTWQQGVVQDMVAPRSHTVAMESGTVLRRNRRHLRLTGEDFNHTTHPDETTDLPPPAVHEYDNNVQPVHHEDKNVSSQNIRRSARCVKPPARLIEQD